MAHVSFKKDKVIPARLFRSYFRLWFASRKSLLCALGANWTTNVQQGFTLGSAYIASGHENLEGTSYAPMYQGKQFVSRMITAQFDSIGYKHVLANLKRVVLDELWFMMQKRCSETFFTVYLVVFMMLHEIAIACQDRRRRAIEQGLKVSVGSYWGRRYVAQSWQTMAKAYHYE
jgi:hypothetical protein